MLLRCLIQTLYAFQKFVFAWNSACRVVPLDGRPTLHQLGSNEHHWSAITYACHPAHTPT